MRQRRGGSCRGFVSRLPHGRKETPHLSVATEGRGVKASLGAGPSDASATVGEEIGGALGSTLDRLAQLHQRAVLELAHALLGDAELAAELFQRGTLLAQAALPDDCPLSRAQLAHRLGEPARADLAVAGGGHDLLEI